MHYERTITKVVGVMRLVSHGYAQLVQAERRLGQLFILRCSLLVRALQSVDMCTPH